MNKHADGVGVSSQLPRGVGIARLFDAAHPERLSLAMRKPGQFEPDALHEFVELGVIAGFAAAAEGGDVSITIEVGGLPSPSSQPIKRPANCEPPEKPRPIFDRPLLRALESLEENVLAAIESLVVVLEDTIDRTPD